MRNYLIFVRKEITEILRTRKLFVLSCVFLLFAFTSPLLARYIMEFISFLLPAEETAMFAFLPDPQWQDSYVQFYGNIMQVGMLTLILLFMGATLDEKRKGTAAIMLMKGLSRTGFVLAKFSVIGGASLALIIASALVNYAYTRVLFDQAGDIAGVIMGACVYWLFMLFMIAAVLLCSSAVKSAAVSAILSLGVLIISLGVSELPRVGIFSPGYITGAAMAYTLGYAPDRFALSLLVTAAFTAGLLALNVHILKNKEI